MFCCSNNTFFINHAVQFEYEHGSCSRCEVYDNECAFDVVHIVTTVLETFVCDEMK